MNQIFPNPVKSSQEEESTGTTIMAIKYDKGVLIAADSRATSGSYVAHRCTDKLEYIHDRIYCLRSGSTADTQTLSKYARYYMQIHSVELGKLPHVKTCAKVFQNFVYQYKDSLSASIIVAGWDPYEGQQVFTVAPGGSLFKNEYALGGSGSGYIQAFVEAGFRNNMTFQEARSLAIQSVSLAMARDGSSGGIIRLVNIQQDKVEREFIDYKDLPYQ